MDPAEDHGELGMPERNALRDRLRACGAPTLAEAYEGAVRLVHEPDYPVRRHLIAHLVRDIANGLPEIVTGSKLTRFDERATLDALAEAWKSEVPSSAKFIDAGLASGRSPTLTVSAALAEQVSSLLRDHERVQHTQRDKLALLMDALRPGSLELRPALEPIIRDLVEVVRWFQAQAHVPRTGVAKPLEPGELERRFRSFEDGLRGLLAGHFELTRELDSILESSPATVETLRRASPLLGGAEQLRHFFQHPGLQDPGWLPILEAGGFFEHAPEPVSDKAQGTVAYWGWPASAYLARMARHAEVQEAVARIASRIETANVRVHDDLAQAALALPAGLAAGLAGKLALALATSSALSLLDERVAALAERLAKAGERSAARQLLAALVEVLPGDARNASPLPPTPRTRINHNTLERVLGAHLAGIVAGLGLEALETLCDALALAMSLSEGSNEAVEDYSHTWRPAIESGGRHDSRDLLVTLVRKAAQQVATEQPAGITAILTELEKRRSLIFRRLALDVIASLTDPSPALVAPHLLDRTLFDHFDTCLEYRALLRDRFTLLDDQQQGVLLGWIDAGVPAGNIRAGLERWSGDTPSDADVDATQRLWRWRRLSVIQELLPPKWAMQARALDEEFGPVEPMDDGARVHGVSVGWGSPLTASDLRSMSVTDLATYLREDWKPLPQQPLASPTGLGQEITRAVEESPQRYATEATALIGLRPTYANAVLHGFASALRSKQAFALDDVLKLAEWVLEQPLEASEPEWTGREDPDWGWARGSVIALLDQALQAEPSPLSTGSRDTVWAILENLCCDPSPQRRGDALEAAVRYAEWVHVQAGQHWSGAGTLADVPEVRRALEKTLDLRESRSPRVHEAIGHQLPWLIFMDEAWVRSHLAQIFPGNPADGELWRAAWRAYLHSGGLDSWAPLHDRVFRVVRAVYWDALERLGPGSESDGRLDSSEERLAEFLMVLYGRGTLAAAGESALVGRFGERASPRLRHHCLWYVGHSLRELEETVAPEVIARFQALWHACREAATRDPGRREELSAFGGWFACDVFDEVWRLEQLEFVLQLIGQIDLDHLVVEQLADLVDKRPAVVMRCFGLLVHSLREPGPTLGWSEATRKILAAALRSADSEAQAQAIRAFHWLGSLGLRRQELLPFSDDLNDPAAIPYFTWDHPTTVAGIHARLAAASEPERDRLLGQILREAKDTDVWRFTTPDEVVRRWPRIERHLGKRRSFWELLLGQWKEQGLLAG